MVSRRKTIRVPRGASLLAMGLLIALPAMGDPRGSGYDLSWYTIDGGTISSGNGSMVLSGTIGQYDASAAMTGGGYELTGGLWGGVASDPTPCDGDANGDGAVDPLDSGYVLARFGCPVGTGDPLCDAADVNGDGEVNPLDSGYVLARFGPCPP